MDNLDGIGKEKMSSHSKDISQEVAKYKRPTYRKSPLSGFLNLDRMVFFTDGVMAIAITILVFGMTIPEGLSEIDLGKHLGDMGHVVFSFLIGFFVIALYWIKHLSHFTYVKRCDYKLVWFNFLFLLSVCFIPFTSNLYGDYPFNSIAGVIYACSLAAVGTTSTLVWVYATTNHRLIDKEMHEIAIRHVTMRSMVGPLLFIISIPFGIFISWYIANALWVSVPLLNYLFGYYLRHRHNVAIDDEDEKID